MERFVFNIGYFWGHKKYDACWVSKRIQGAKEIEKKTNMYLNMPFKKHQLYFLKSV